MATRKYNNLIVAREGLKYFIEDRMWLWEEDAEKMRKLSDIEYDNLLDSIYEELTWIVASSVNTLYKEEYKKLKGEL